MKNLPLLLAVLGLVLVVLAIVVRIPGGLLFSPRGVLEFAQAMLLSSIAIGIAALVKK